MPIGTFMFSGPPEISRSTVTLDGNGEQRVAWDAVAVVPAVGARTLSLMNWNIAGATLNDGDNHVSDRITRRSSNAGRTSSP